MPTGSGRVNLGRARHQLHGSWGPVAGGVQDPQPGVYSLPQHWGCVCAALHMRGHPPKPFITPEHPQGAHLAARAAWHTRKRFPSRRCPCDIAQMCVPTPPLQTCRHMHKDTGRGLTLAHTCTPRCAHAARTAAAKAASCTDTTALACRQQRTTPTRRTPTQTTFLPPPDTQTHTLRLLQAPALRCPCPER